MIENPRIPPATNLLKLRMWLEKNFSTYEEYDELWEMFRAVVTGSSWGTSEFGGPVWLMDFSLENLQKLFPNNPLLETAEEKRSAGFDEHGRAKSEFIRRFCDWFSWRADAFIKWQGLGNVLLKCEVGDKSTENNFSFYGYGTFLDILKSLIDGKLNLYDLYFMEKYDFSVSEEKIVNQKTFYTRLDGGFVKQFPCEYGSYLHYYKENPTYGKCYELPHFSNIKGNVITENKPEKFIALIVNDLMEYKAQGYEIGSGKNGITYPYPQLKYDTYLNVKMSRDHHFRPTNSFFIWQCTGRKNEKIDIRLPQIDAKYGEFWHRQFPPKQNWRAIK